MKSYGKMLEDAQICDKMISSGGLDPAAISNLNRNAIEAYHRLQMVVSLENDSG